MRIQVKRTVGTEPDGAHQPVPNRLAPVLELSDVRVTYRVAGASLEAVSGVSLALGPGEAVALIGESGSGKSTVARAILGLLKPPAGVTGSIRVSGTELVGMSDCALGNVRGPMVGLVFQDPLAALDPCFPVGYQIAEMFRVHRGVRRRAAMEAAVETMDIVGIPTARRRARSYPHEFSGGMRQRVVIAMAIALRPRLLVADEPTSALDVTVQAQILELLQQLRSELGMAMLLITHDLALAAENADRIAVMYAGTLVEVGAAQEVYVNPVHPYTKALLSASPHAQTVGEALRSIEGSPPTLVERRRGCAFTPRCPLARPGCADAVPRLEPVSDDHTVACFVVADECR